MMCQNLKFNAVTIFAAAIGGASASGQLALTDFEDGLTGTFYGADAFSATSSMPGATKPRLTVADDAAGLGSGNALFVESAGGGSELTAFLNTPVTIGPNVGDGIALEFDWRIDTSTGSQPSAGSNDFRFGFFSDSDGDIGSEFGTFSTYEGGELVSTDPAVFGSTGGEFDTSSGPIADDYGVYVVTAFNRNVVDPNALPTSATDNVFESVRIRDEQTGDTSGILSGAPGTGETVTSGAFDVEEGAPEDLISGGTNYGELRNGNANTFKLELIRANDGVEDTILGRYTVTNALGTTVFEADRDPFTQMEQTTFDYLVFENSNGDFDYVIDNVRVFELPEVSGVLEGDYDGNGFVSQADLDLVLLNWGDAALPGGFDETAIPGGGPFDSLISQNELDGVLLNWGDGTPPVNTIPEPTGLALLGLGGLGLMVRRRA